MTTENTVKITNADLTNMAVEDLLQLSGDAIQLVSDRVTLPAGSYAFTVASADIEEIGKDKEKAIAVTLVITACVQLENVADQEVLDAIDLATNPVELKAIYKVNSKDGFSFRDFMTFTHVYAVQSLPNGAQANGMDRIAALPGAQGVTVLTVNSYLPEGKPDTPSNYVHNNRVKSTATVWN